MMRLWKIFFCFVLIGEIVCKPSSANLTHDDSNDTDLAKDLSQLSSNVFKHHTENQMTSRLSKRSIRDNFDDSHCIDNFEVSDKTIIRTIESKSNGAIFLNNSEVETFERCLRFCCSTPTCTVGVWDQQNGGCYLFDCGPSTPEEFKCRFTANEAFTSGALLVNRHAFEMSRWDHQSKHENLLQDLVGEVRSSLAAEASNIGAQFGTVRDQEAQPQQGCGQYEFSCQSGECIAVYDVCNGIPQCSDGSDEDPTVCPTTTAKPYLQPRLPVVTLPISTPTRPPNIEMWGREGERYPIAGGSNAGGSNVPATAFQHRNPAIQVPPLQPQPVGYGYDYNNFGYQGPQQMPGNFGPNSGYFVPPGQHVQQQFPVVGNHYPIQNFNVPKPQQQQQQTATSQATTTSVRRITISTTLSIKPTTENPHDLIRNELLGNLNDSDFVMETPSAAIFTLIIGSLFSCVMCAVVVCSCRKARYSRTRKRNLASDADGDYLVNGMYL